MLQCDPGHENWCTLQKGSKSGRPTSTCFLPSCRPKTGHEDSTSKTFDFLAPQVMYYEYLVYKHTGCLRESIFSSSAVFVVLEVRNCFSSPWIVSSKDLKTKTNKHTKTASIDTRNASPVGQKKRGLRPGPSVDAHKSALAPHSHWLAGDCDGRLQAAGTFHQALSQQRELHVGQRPRIMRKRGARSFFF